MEKCPDIETLERFVAYELEEEMNDNILLHLSTCDSCRKQVESLLVEEPELLKSLFSEMGRSTQVNTSLLCDCLSKAVITAYADNLLNKDQIKHIESHLRKCDNCMVELLDVQRSLNSPIELDLDMQYLTSRLVSETHILEIVVKIKDDLIELLRHTGALLTIAPHFGAVRGRENKYDIPIVIRKDFADRDLSIEVTITKETNGSVGALSLSVMKLKSEEFMTGIEIELSGGAMTQRGTTDEDGVVFFPDVSIGSYGIKVGRDLIVQIAIE